LFGGNLAMLAALCGTPLTPPARGCILFLEDVGEPAYRVDRMITQLRQSGVFEGVAGLALGRFTECDEEGQRTVRDVLIELADRLSVPAVLDFPIGHVDHNWTLPLGCKALLDANRASLRITEPAVSG
jgi:muramoyltetrapeptide carboxypeptidase